MAWGAVIGGAINAFAGSRAKPSQSSSGSENITRNSDATREELLTQLAPEDLEALRAAFPIILESAQGLTRAQAMQDIAGFTDSAIRVLKEQGIPQIFAQQVQSGAYGTTSAALLGNDLAARTAEAISRNTVETITRYSDAQTNALQALQGIGGVIKGAETRATSSTTSRETSRGTTSGRQSGSSGISPALAALGAGLNAYAAAQQDSQANTTAGIQDNRGQNNVGDPDFVGPP